MTRVHVCSYVGPHGESCPELVTKNEPCPQHGRPKNARWSKDRDPAAHDRWQRAVKQRDGHRCTRCNSTWRIQAHHIRPGYELADGITLCGRCHGLLDKHARA